MPSLDGHSSANLPMVAPPDKPGHSGSVAGERLPGLTMPGTLLGLKLVRMPCTIVFDGWRRTNRNNRINRKWRKRYGAKRRCEKTSYRIGWTFYVCPCVEQAIRKQMEVGR